MGVEADGSEMMWNRFSDMNIGTYDSGMASYSFSSPTHVEGNVFDKIGHAIIFDGESFEVDGKLYASKNVVANNMMNFDKNKLLYNSGNVSGPFWMIAYWNKLPLTVKMKSLAAISDGKWEASGSIEDATTMCKIEGDKKPIYKLVFYRGTSMHEPFATFDVEYNTQKLAKADANVSTDFKATLDISTLMQNAKLPSAGEDICVTVQSACNSSEYFSFKLPFNIPKPLSPMYQPKKPPSKATDNFRAK
jgi:hypothetical protein